MPTNDFSIGVYVLKTGSLHFSTALFESKSMPVSLLQTDTPIPNMLGPQYSVVRTGKKQKENFLLCWSRNQIHRQNGQI